MTHRSVEYLKVAMIFKKGREPGMEHVSEGNSILYYSV